MYNKQTNTIRKAVHKISFCFINVMNLLIILRGKYGTKYKNRA